MTTKVSEPYPTEFEENDYPVVLTRTEAIIAMYGERPEDFITVDNSDEIIFGWELLDSEQKAIPKDIINNMPPERITQFYDEEGEL